METMTPNPEVIYVERKRKRRWPWIVGGLFVLLIGGCGVSIAAVGGAAHQVSEDAKNDPTHMTLAEYNRIATGMTLAQVQQIAGSEGAPETEATIIPGHTVTSFRWDGNTVLSSASVQFENGVVYSKSQAGLK